MSFFICDKCNKKHEIFVRQSDKVYKNWNVELLGSIPLNSIISQTSDQGMPYVFQYENNISKIFCNLTKRLNQIINESVKKEIYKYKAYCKTEDKSKLPVI
jgi:septum formation inhibitor-activating ATPase MinD